jgi:hypothetical protein
MTTQPTVIRLADVEREIVRFLWAGYFPLGKLVTVDADPGLGKTTVLGDIGARVTRGAPAVTEHRQVAATLPKVLAGVVVGDSATGPLKNPAKQRAANIRWANRDRIREAQIRRAEGA